MNKKNFFIFFFFFTSLCINAQDANEFLAEEFLVNVYCQDTNGFTYKEKKTYISTDNTPPIILGASFLQKILCEDINLCDSSIANDFFVQCWDWNDTTSFRWKGNAPIFKSPKGEKIILKENVSQKIRRRNGFYRISMPIFTKDQNYALISVYSQRDYHLKKKFWQKPTFAGDCVGYIIVYRRNGDKWDRIGSSQILIC